MILRPFSNVKKWLFWLKVMKLAIYIYFLSFFNIQHYYFTRILCRYFLYIYSYNYSKLSYCDRLPWSLTRQCWYTFVEYFIGQSSNLKLLIILQYNYNSDNNNKNNKTEWEFFLSNLLVSLVVQSAVKTNVLRRLFFASPSLSIILPPSLSGWLPWKTEFFISR